MINKKQPRKKVVNYTSMDKDRKELLSLLDLIREVYQKYFLDKNKGNNPKGG